MSFKWNQPTKAPNGLLSEWSIAEVHFTDSNCTISRPVACLHENINVICCVDLSSVIVPLFVGRFVLQALWNLVGGGKLNGWECPLYSVERISALLLLHWHLPSFITEICVLAAMSGSEGMSSVPCILAAWWSFLDACVSVTFYGRSKWIVLAHRSSRL